MISSLRAADTGDTTDPQVLTTAMSLQKKNLSSFVEEASLDRDKHPATMDQDMPLMQALRRYPAAVGWCIVVSASLIMEAYDGSLIVNLPADAAFNRAFGRPLPDGTYQLEALWQSALGIAPTIGNIVGLLIGGVAADQLGYRKIIFTSLVVVAGLMFVPFFARSVTLIAVGFLLLGVPFGTLQMACVAYAAEACPNSLRGHLTTYTNFCWAFGQLLGAGVFRGSAGIANEWGFRIPMVIHWVWPLPIAIAVLLAPESPWWLLRQGRREEARASLRRLMSSQYASAQDVNATLEYIERMSARDEALYHSRQSTYLDCFRGTNLRRTEIVCVTWVNQITCGSALFTSSSYFFTAVGLSEQLAFTMTMALAIMGMTGTILTWYLMSKFGRRQLYLVGSIVMSLLTVSIGIAAVTGDSFDNRWAMVGLLLAWVVVYNCTVGPICYTVVSEIPSSYMRAKTMVLGCAAYNVATLTVFFLMPHMINPGAWNWGGKSGFFWGGIAGLTSVWIFFRLPETKGRTYGELDFLFEQRIPTRKFDATVVPSMEDVPQRC